MTKPDSQREIVMKRIAVVVLLAIGLCVAGCATTNAVAPAPTPPGNTTGCGKPEQCRATKRAMMYQILRDFAARATTPVTQP